MKLVRIEDVKENFVLINLEHIVLVKEGEERDNQPTIIIYFSTGQIVETYQSFASFDAMAGRL